MRAARAGVLAPLPRGQGLIESLQLLADANAAAASSLDLGQMLTAVMGLLTGRGAEACVVELVSNEGFTRYGAPIWPNTEAGRTVADLVARVAETGRPTCIAASFEPSGVSGVSAVGGMSGAVERMLGQRRRLTLVPLAADGRVLGVLTVLSASETHPDLGVLVEVGRSVGRGICNAMAYREAVESSSRREDAIVSLGHDLRNPLGVVILTLSEMLERANLDEQKVGDRRRLEAALRAADRMHELLRDLLELSRLEAGHLPFDRRACSVEALVNDAVALGAPIANAKGLTIRTDVEPNLPQVYGNRNSLLRVLSNLIGNAIEFTPKGEVIEVRAHACRDGIHVEVVDAGEGIAPESLPRIFERFFQAKPSRPGGTGLGLSIAKAFVEAHGGRISAASEPGRGATFAFTLPVTR
ncbi:Phosphate regulon sensor protein PhoR (SphS) [Labilithrix luteola]|uniref:histidine kinase n=1 Tax=Labilithrix luteola TaxID=1391654 RepID=A0A0K1PYE9_9BACT|nr:HAMP domain-containing sensor histidine kinase [Labilithrix luteola]AKU98553.1 Phosphate regulon sensor protein PhoR (SphS) [Labilithrix luteola]